MKRKIVGVVLTILIIVLAVKLTDSNAQEKAASQIKKDSFENSDIFEKFDSNKESYNEIFNAQFEKCVQTGGPQKYKVIASDPLVTGLAASVGAGKKTDFEKVYSAFGFASENISYKIYSNWRSTPEILGTLDGDCTDKSIVLVSLLKNYGIESYVAYGEKISNYSHAWVAAKISGKWVQMDATTNDFFYVQNCLEDEECENKNIYEPVAGMFNSEMSLKCDNG